MAKAKLESPSALASQSASGLEVVVGSKRNPTVADELTRQLCGMQLSGTLYLGYPVIASADETVVVDALLTCLDHGVVVFDFEDVEGLGRPEELTRRHDDLYLAVEQQLKRSRDLVRRRHLSVEIATVSFLPDEPEPELRGENLVATPGTLQDLLGGLPAISPDQLKLVNAAVQRVNTIKPAHKRLNVKKASSHGAKIREIEREIANLDRWQKAAAIETPDGPQRIRGLAGSGKTIVLALKAAYLHASYPEWTIAITFWTRSLYQQFRDLVRRFSFETLGDEPDWERLRVIHAWGSGSMPGFYSTIAQRADLPVRDFLSARRAYGRADAFGGACEELLAGLQGADLEPFFDAVLIDEAQDLPPAFFQLAYGVTREPKRIVWAYDELQNLSRHAMAPLADLFGSDEAGQPYLEGLPNIPGGPRRDMLLPVCYRNTPWALTIAHALGFGIYREQGLVQFFGDLELWGAVGYEVAQGQLRPGSKVVLRRRPDASPDYFRRLLSPDDAVQWQWFRDPVEQATWVAAQIQRNLTEDELEARDVLVIFGESLSFQKQAAPLIAELHKRGISSHMAGVTSSRDELFVDDSIALTGIYRAKGNEAPMVYILNSEYGYEGLELIKRRNTLFTAITRSRAWVRVCGCGNGMRGLIAEIERVVSKEHQLAFRVPTAAELARLRRIHRERPPEEQRKVAEAETGLEEIVRRLESGDLAPEQLDQDLLQRLTQQLATARR